MSKESISKIYLILEKIEYIEQIVKNSGSITQALEDSITTRPAILMHLTAIAEQFNKLKKAHDYEGVNLAIVEWIIRNGLPKFKNQCEILIKQ